MVLSTAFLLLLIQLAPSVLSAPSHPSHPRAAASGPINVNLLRKRYGPVNQDSVEDWGAWAKSQREILRNKYSQDSNSKRSSGENM
jgi:hypothetical protein